MKNLPCLGFGLVLSGFAATAHAHFMWGIPSVSGSSVSFELAESPGDSAKLFGIDRVTLDADRVHLSGATVVSKPGGISLLYGVHGDFLVLWSAKAASNLDAAGKPTWLPLDIVLVKSKGHLVATVRKSGRPVGGATFYIFNPTQRPQLKSRHRRGARLKSRCPGAACWRLLPSRSTRPVATTRASISKKNGTTAPSACAFSE